MHRQPYRTFHCAGDSSKSWYLRSRDNAINHSRWSTNRYRISKPRAHAKKKRKFVSILAHFFARFLGHERDENQFATLSAHVNRTHDRLRINQTNNNKLTSPAFASLTMYRDNVFGVRRQKLVDIVAERLYKLDARRVVIVERILCALLCGERCG